MQTNDQPSFCHQAAFQCLLETTCVVKDSSSFSFDHVLVSPAQFSSSGATGALLWCWCLSCKPVKDTHTWVNHSWWSQCTSWDFTWLTDEELWLYSFSRNYWFSGSVLLMSAWEPYHSKQELWPLDVQRICVLCGIHMVHPSSILSEVLTCCLGWWKHLLSVLASRKMLLKCGTWWRPLHRGKQTSSAQPES